MSPVPVSIVLLRESWSKFLTTLCCKHNLFTRCCANCPNVFGSVRIFTVCLSKKHFAMSSKFNFLDQFVWGSMCSYTSVTKLPHLLLCSTPIIFIKLLMLSLLSPVSPSSLQSIFVLYRKQFHHQ